MKLNKNITVILLAAASLTGVSSCQQTLPEQFGVDTDKIEIGADGGVETIRVNSSETWVAKTQDPWITVSPANGRGPAECRILIDSTLKFEGQTGRIRIQTIGSGERQDIEVHQKGYEKMIALEEKEHALESYADYGKRSFVVKVRSNVEFEVSLPDSVKSWLSYEMPAIRLDRGSRPRVVPVTFNWTVNFNEGEKGNRTAVVKFDAKNGEALDIKDDLKIVQKGAEEIQIGIEGDKKAIQAIANAMNCYLGATSGSLENWENVTVWEDGPNKGRVKSLRLEMVNTREPIPFQVKYLTACEELVIYSNVNSFLLSLTTGPHIAKMPQLKRLTIGAYGLTELDPSFVELKNLEYLNLSGNNFQKIPDLLTKENFPKLHAIELHANQRNVIYDLSNAPKKDYGGFMESSFTDDPEKASFPRRLLEWDTLDTLRLSVNYLQGELPDMMDYPIRWSEEEVMQSDTLKTAAAQLVGKPKVLPNLNYLAINLNRLSGKLPDWLLYHPKMDYWMPFLLVFEQEGKDQKGKSAGFSNRPANLDYYYAVYPNKKYNPNKNKE